MATVAAPTIKCEIRFPAGPDWGDASLGSFVLGVSGLGDPSATYSNVSSLVRDVRISRGKNRELEKFQAGHCRVVFSNLNRELDPSYTSSAYYPNVKPGRMIRLYAVYDSVEYPIFKGTIRSWEYGYVSGGPNKGDAIATALASDILYDVGNTEFTDTTSAGLSGQQVISILDSINLTDRSIDTGIHNMQSTAYTRTQTLSTLHNISYSEGVDTAAIFANRTNQLVYEDAASLDVKTNIGTLGTSSLPITDISIEYASDLIKNNIAYTSTGLAQQVQSSASSITDYGLKSLTKTGLLLQNNSDTSSLALLALDQFAEAELRIREVKLRPRANNALMLLALQFELRQLCTIEFKPPGTGTMTQDHFIIGIKYHFQPGGNLECTLRLNSTTGKVGANFVLGSAVLGTSKMGF
tara:strand:- start:535 stop:1764 length:1230 start_codon:yes stop_codon:yes gene_type:complete